MACSIVVKFTVAHCGVVTVVVTVVPEEKHVNDIYVKPKIP